MNILELIDRKKLLMTDDVSKHSDFLKSEIETSAFLMIGGAGSIGQAVVKEIFSRNPKKLHVVDLSENNLVELVRDLRSSFGYISGDFKTFAVDCGSTGFNRLFENEGPYDYVLNLSAMKHVRSERDPYTLMRMIDTNIINTINTIDLAVESGVKKYFCVSTDKAANPVNMMGASKRIMEMFLIERGRNIPVSTARFANVAFSDGSLPHGFHNRIAKNQPLAVPSDIKRYFVIPEEAGKLCMMSALLGNNEEIFFPKLSEELNLTTFTSVAERYLESIGYKPLLCSSEEEARSIANERRNDGTWPCYFSPSDTTGEKPYEEFYTENEIVDMQRFKSLGVVKNTSKREADELQAFLDGCKRIRENNLWDKEEFVSLFKQLLPELQHKETGKNLDNKM